MRLKKGVRNILAIICFIAIFIMASECENTIIFILSHILAISIFGICSTLLIKY